MPGHARVSQRFGRRPPRTARKARRSGAPRPPDPATPRRLHPHAPHRPARVQSTLVGIHASRCCVVTTMKAQHLRKPIRTWSLRRSHVRRGHRCPWPRSETTRVAVGATGELRVAPRTVWPSGGVWDASRGEKERPPVRRAGPPPVAPRRESGLKDRQEGSRRSGAGRRTPSPSPVPRRCDHAVPTAPRPASSRADQV